MSEEQSSPEVSPGGKLPGLSQFTNNITLRAKLIAGFASILVVIAFLVVMVNSGLSNVTTVQDRVINTRVPTNVAGHDLVNGVNYSLAALRGWMILDKENFKVQRAEAWAQIDEHLNLLAEKSKNWTVPENKERLARLQKVLAEFRTAQQQVEDIANTPEEQPANLILFKDAAPRAGKMVASLTALIDIEKAQTPTPERRRLLVALADSRGSFAGGLASIRAYLLSGDQRFAKDFDAKWAVNSDRFAKLKAMTGSLTSAQRGHFKTYSALREEFAPLPPKMFAIRGSDQWNLANYLLGTEAAPRAVAALGILDEMVQSQNELVRTDVAKLEAAAASTESNVTIGAVFAFFLALGIGFLVIRAITGPLKRIVRTVQVLAAGDYDERVVVENNDEIGFVAEGVNEMVDKIVNLIRETQKERDVLQDSMMRLLEEVAEVADGDLTIQAVVTEDTTGALADSFNFMIAELCDIIGTVQAATNMMTDSADGVSRTATQLADDNVKQQTQVQEATTAITDMATSIRAVSHNADESAKAATSALESAEKGAEVVQKTVEGMNGIRQRVQETSKRIKRLGESSQEIGEIVQLIETIADRTSMLALNASIQAAMAGEAGRGFAVVAEEVERLAERAADSTKRIATLVGSVQTETNEAGAAMEATTLEVVAGSELAIQAGNVLEEIRESSFNIAEIVNNISVSANQQVLGAEAVARSMSNISDVTTTTTEGAKNAAQSVQGLVVVASELTESLQRFKLPSASA